jgi:hypothetical protein
VPGHDSCPVLAVWGSAESRRPLNPYWTAASRSLANGKALGVGPSKGIRCQRALRSPPQLQDHNPCRRWASPPSDTVTTPTRRANRDADDLGGGVVDHLQSKRGVQCCQLRWIGAIEHLTDVSESVDDFRDLLIGQDVPAKTVFKLSLRGQGLGHRCALPPASDQ